MVAEARLNVGCAQTQANYCGRPARHRPWGDQQNLRPDLGCRNLSCCCFCNDHDGRHRIGWVLVELLSKLGMEVLKAWQLYLSECDPNTGTVAHYIVRNNMHEIAVSRLLMNIQNTIMSVALVPFPFRLSLLCAPWWLFHIYFLTSTTKLYKTSLHRHSLVALQQESSAVVHLNWTQTMLMRTVGSWLRIASTLAKHAALRSLQKIIRWNCLLLRNHVSVHQG